jgi:hypothetical protein
MTERAFSVYITEALGKGRSAISIVTSAIFVLTSFFYIYTLASFLRVGIDFMQNKLSYNALFNFYIVNKDIDHIIIGSAITIWLALSIKGIGRFIVSAIYGGFTIIAVLVKLDVILNILALLSIPLLILLFTCNRFVPKMRILNKEVDTSLCTNYLVIAGMVIGIEGIIASLTALFFTVSPAASASSSASASMHILNYAYELFILLSSSSPILMILLIVCLPVKVLLNALTPMIASKVRKNKNENENENSQYISNNNYNSNNDDNKNRNNRVSTKTKIIYLSVFMLLSATMTLIPHQQAVNKDNRPIGSDILVYTKTIKHLFSYSNDPKELLRHAFITEPPFHGDRPISLLLFFTAAKIIPVTDPIYVIDYMPVILGPALVLVIYLLTREMTSNDTISILAAFLTAMSFQVLVGVYAGFYANWFALIIGYLSLVFLFKYLKRPSKSSFFIYSTLTILLLLSHVYTWSMIAIVTGVFLVVMLSLNYYRRRNIILLLLVVLSSAAIDAIKASITGSSGGIVGDIHISSEALGYKQFASRWNNLLDSTRTFLGGLFGNFIVLSLGLYWLFRANHLKPFNIFIMIFLSVGIITLFFGDWVVQSRVFYNVPFQIPAAISLNYIIKQGFRGTMILLPICIWLIAVSIVVLSNMNPILVGYITETNNRFI